MILFPPKTLAKSSLQHKSFQCLLSLFKTVLLVICHRFTCGVKEFPGISDTVLVCFSYEMKEEARDWAYKPKKRKPNNQKENAIEMIVYDSNYLFCVSFDRILQVTADTISFKLYTSFFEVCSLSASFVRLLFEMRHVQNSLWIVYESEHTWMFNDEHRWSSLYEIVRALSSLSVHHTHTHARRDWENNASWRNQGKHEYACACFWPFMHLSRKRLGIRLMQLCVWQI